MNYTKMGNGFLMRSDYYEEGGSKPEFFGKISIGAEGDENPFEGELAAWVKMNDKTGKKYFSIAVSVKDEQKPETETETEPEAETETETDVPF